MTYIDEQIARKFKQERLKKQEAENERKEKEAEALIDAEMVRDGILNGKCTVLDRQFTFAKYTVCKEHFSIWLPTENIEIQNDEEDLFKSANNELGFSCTIAATNDTSDFQPLSVYKENMINNMKKVSFKWLEEGAQLVDGYKIMYLDFITLTGIVNVHQNMWFVAGPYGQAQVVVNYDHAEAKYWKHMIEQIRNTFEIHTGQA